VMRDSGGRFDARTMSHRPSDCRPPASRAQ
jgi:hypothetical protein